MHVTVLMKSFSKHVEIWLTPKVLAELTTSLGERWLLERFNLETPYDAESTLLPRCASSKHVCFWNVLFLICSFLDLQPAVNLKEHSELGHIKWTRVGVDCFDFVDTCEVKLKELMHPNKSALSLNIRPTISSSCDYEHSLIIRKPKFKYMMDNNLNETLEEWNSK